MGRLLAERLGREFIDADRRLVQVAGMSIKTLVAQEGWPGFRKREQLVLTELCGLPRHVIATGGGVVTDPENIRLMQTRGKLVWLRVATATILDRMRRDATSGDFRPALTDQGLIDEIETVLTARTPLYQKAADIVVDTDLLDVQGVVVKVLERLNKEGMLNRAGK